jgi:3-phenylpropionate/trans-cinnamate dioxygenase ferredoxin component
MSRTRGEESEKTMAQWVKVAQVGELAPGEKKQLDLDGVEVALFNVDGEYYAIEDVCTHDGAPLAHGRFRGEEITCPRHGARFNVKTGAALCMPAFEPVETYQLKIEGNDILIEVEQ